MAYYLHTSGNEVIGCSTEGDWMYALSGDEYQVSDRQGKIVKSGLSKGLTFLVEKNKLVKIGNGGRVEV